MSVTPHIVQLSYGSDAICSTSDGHSAGRVFCEKEIFDKRGLTWRLSKCSVRIVNRPDCDRAVSRRGINARVVKCATFSVEISALAFGSRLRALTKCASHARVTQHCHPVAQALQALQAQRAAPLHFTFYMQTHFSPIFNVNLLFRRQHSRSCRAFILVALHSFLFYLREHLRGRVLCIGARNFPCSKQALPLSVCSKLFAVSFA